MSGGARLVLEGDNFAPLGDGLQVVFDTPGNVVANVSSNLTAMTATYHSPTLLSCVSPPYKLRLGETSAFINTTYNSSRFAGGADASQTVTFTYYDRSRPPSVVSLHPRHAPIGGRPLDFVGGEGVWGQWRGSVPTGGVLLLGHNFAPTNYLWCAFGMPPHVYSTARGPWRWSRAAYLNASAVACEVPPGYVGDFDVAASHDDLSFSAQTSTITYYDPRATAELSRSQQISLATIDAGFYKVDNDGEAVADPTKATLTLAGTNFAPFTESGLLLCRYGPHEVLRDPTHVPSNNTDPINLLENVVHATFVSAYRMRCQAPYRPAGSMVPVHVSIGGRD